MYSLYTLTVSTYLVTNILACLSSALVCGFHHFSSLSPLRIHPMHRGHGAVSWVDLEVQELPAHSAHSPRSPTNATDHPRPGKAQFVCIRVHVFMCLCVSAPRR